MTNRKFTLATAVLCAMYLGCSSAVASDAGAFIGGMITSRVLNNMEQRTQAEQVQAYNSSARAQQPAQPAAPAAASPQQKLDQLDKLAAGGYITKEEYQTRRKAILDSM